jgi:hypothetical protein
MLLLLPGIEYRSGNSSFLVDKAAQLQVFSGYFGIVATLLIDSSTPIFTYLPKLI